MRRLKKLITAFRYDRTPPLPVPGPGVRLDPQRYVCELARNASGAFPTTSDLYVKTRVARPASMKRLIGFESNHVVHTHPTLGALTSVRFRMSTDGSNELYWDGAAWSPAAPGEWNTEAEIAAHISTFPIADRGFQVITNLSTTDPTLTPRLHWVKVLWESDIEFQEDYVVRSFIPMLRNSVRPIGETMVVMAATGTTVSLSEVETPYTIVSIDSVYNITNDPDMLTDLFVSLVGSDVTMSAAAGSGDHIMVRFVYAPMVALTTGQEYGEVDRAPSIVIDEVRMENERDMVGDDSVSDKAAGSGWRLPAGRQADFVMSLRVVADKEKDAQRMSEALAAFFDEHTHVQSRGLDEPFTMVMERPYTHNTSPGQKGLHGGRLGARIVGAVFYLAEAEQVYVATNPMTMGGGGNLSF